MTAALSLESLQVWFQTAITHPLGVSGASFAEASDRSAAAGGAESIDSVVTRSRALSAAERLQIYAIAYFSRLVECLQSDFPAFRHVVGDEAFAGFVLEYLQQCPSQSYTLSDLGQRFPEFLEATAAGRNELSLDPATKDWSDFVIDLATLERHYAEVFDGDGSEGTAALQVDELSRVPPEQWGDVRFGLCPSLRIVSLRFPAHQYVTAVRQEKPTPAPPREETWLAIFREDFIVRRVPLRRAQTALLTAIHEGEPLATAMQTAASLVIDSESEMAELQSRVADWFFEWTQSGWIRRLILPVS